MQVFCFKGLGQLAPLFNVLALLVTLAGAWLLLATRWREQQAAGRLAAADVDVDDSVNLLDAATQRLNRVFYAMGGLSLALALALSWLSVRL